MTEFNVQYSTPKQPTPTVIAITASDPTAAAVFVRGAYPGAIVHRVKVKRS